MENLILRRTKAEPFGRLIPSLLARQKRNRKSRDDRKLYQDRLKRAVPARPPAMLGTGSVTFPFGSLPREKLWRKKTLREEKNNEQTARANTKWPCNIIWFWLTIHILLHFATFVISMGIPCCYHIATFHKRKTINNEFKRYIEYVCTELN